MSSSEKVWTLVFSIMLTFAGCIRVFDLTMDQSVMGYTSAETQASHIYGSFLLLGGCLGFFLLVVDLLNDRKPFMTEEERLQACTRSQAKWASYGTATKRSVMRSQNEEALARK